MKYTAAPAGAGLRVSPEGAGAAGAGADTVLVLAGGALAGAAGVAGGGSRLHEASMPMTAIKPHCLCMEAPPRPFEAL
jgi:hypothetical protein